MSMKQKNLFRRALARLLTVVMVFSLFPAIPVGAEDDPVSLTLEFHVSPAEAEASVTLDTGESATTVDGEASLSVVVTESGSLGYTVSAEGYESASGTVSYTVDEGVAAASPVSVTLEQTAASSLVVDIRDLEIGGGVSIAAVAINGRKASVAGSSNVYAVDQSNQGGSYAVSVLYTQGEDYYALKDTVTFDSDGRGTLTGVGSELAATEVAKELDLTAESESVTVSSGTVIADLSNQVDGQIVGTPTMSENEKVSLHDTAVTFTEPASAEVSVRTLKINEEDPAASALTDYTLNVKLSAVPVTGGSITFGSETLTLGVGGEATVPQAQIVGASLNNVGALTSFSYIASGSYFTFSNMKVKANAVGKSGYVSAVPSSKFYSFSKNGILYVEVSLNAQTIEAEDQTLDYYKSATLKIGAKAETDLAYKITSAKLAGASTAIVDSAKIAALAQVDDGGLFTVNGGLDALGTYRVEITAAASELYSECTKTVTVTVTASAAKAEFESESITATYAEDLVSEIPALSVEGYTGELNWTYTFTEIQGYAKDSESGKFHAVTLTGEDLKSQTIAAFDSETDPKAIRFGAAGVVTVEATAAIPGMAEDAVVTAVYTVTVERAEAEIKFENEEIEVGSGKTVENALTEPGYKSDAVWKSTDEAIASVDSEGAVTLTNWTGETEIQVSYPADDCYEGAEASYTVKVSPLKEGAPAITARDGDVWYNSIDSVLLQVGDTYNLAKPADGEIQEVYADGVSLSVFAIDNADGDAVGANVAVYVIEYTDAEKTDVACVYQKMLPGFKVDCSAPNVDKVEYGSYVSNALYDSVFFFRGGDAEANYVEVTYSEDLSGLKEVWWSLRGEKTRRAYSAPEAAPEGAMSWVARLNLDEAGVDLDKVYLDFGAENMAGEPYTNEPETQIVLDKVSPALSISYDGTFARALKDGEEAEKQNADTLIFSKNVVKANIQIEEAYFDPQNVEVYVTTDGVASTKPQAGEWTKTGDDAYVLTVELPYVANELHTYSLRVAGTDIVGNPLVSAMEAKVGETDEYVSQTIVVDSAAPVVQVSYIEPARMLNDQYEEADESEAARIYYQGAFSATVSVQEDYLLEGDIQFAVLKDGTALGEDSYTVVWDSAYREATITVVPESTDNEESEYVLTITGKDAAGCPLTYSYAQFAEKIANNEDTDTTDHGTYQSKPLVIDTKDPKVSVSYNTPARLLKSIDGTYQVVENDADADVIVFPEIIATVGVEDKYFAKADFDLTVTCDGAALAESDYNVAWSDNTATVTISAQQDDGQEHLYQIQVTGTDAVGHKFTFGESDNAFFESLADHTYVSKQMLIDNSIPTATITFDREAKVLVDEAEKPAENYVTAVYDGGVTATIRVTDDYFDGKADTEIQVTCDGTTEVKTPAWSYDAESKSHVATVELPAFSAPTGGELHYQLTVSGKDASGNSMEFTNECQHMASKENNTYTSKDILVDTRGPRVTLEYTDQRSEDPAPFGDSFFTARSAAITVQDDSFDSTRLDYFEISGTEAQGDMPAPQAWSGGEGNWKTGVDFTTDANYTFAINMKDNAGNPASFENEDMRKNDGQNIVVDSTTGAYSAMFTVDATEPNVTYTYSSGVWEDLIGAVFYRFYNKNVPLTVTVEATDAVSGVGGIVAEYYATDDHYQTTIEESDTPDPVTGANGYISGPSSHSFSFDVGETEINGGFVFTVTDYAGNQLAPSDAQHTADQHDQPGEVREVVDNVAPNVTVTYSGFEKMLPAAERGPEFDTYYFNANSYEVTLSVTEINFYPEDVTVLVSENGGAFKRITIAPENWTKLEGTDTHTAPIPLSSADTYYRFSVSYRDRSQNEAGISDGTHGGGGTYEYTSPVLVLDTTGPVVDVEYSTPTRLMASETEEAKTEEDAKFAIYQDTVTATITVTDTNFYPENYTIKRINTWNGEQTEVYEGKDRKWTDNGDQHTCTVYLDKVPGDYADYTLTVEGKDYSGNGIVDGELMLCKSMETGKYTSKTLCVDDVVPVVTVTYRPGEKALVNEDEVIGDKYHTVVFDETVTATISVNERFFAGTCTVLLNGSEYKPAKWDYENSGGGIHDTEVKMEQDEDQEIYYYLKVKGTDAAEHPFTYDLDNSQYVESIDEETGTYNAKEILVDNLAPKVTVSYDSTANDGAVPGFYTSCTVTITVEDASFDPNKTEQFTCTVTGIGSDPDAEAQKPSAQVAWTGPDQGENNKSLWTAVYTFEEDYNYVFEFKLNDNAGHKAEITSEETYQDYETIGTGTYENKFTKDATAPVDIVFSYSKPFTADLIDTILYRFFNIEHDDLVISVRADDGTSGLQNYEYKYTKTGASDTFATQFEGDLVAKDQAGKVTEIETVNDGYVIGKKHLEKSVTEKDSGLNLNGQFTYTVTDFAGNVHESSDQNHEPGEHDYKDELELVNEDQKTPVLEVVDNIAPNVTITISGAHQYVDHSYYYTDTSLVEFNGAYYYSKTSLMVPLTVDEANFYPEDVEVTVVRDGAETTVPDLVWKPAGGDVHTADIPLTVADSYYVIHVKYSDRSGNKMTLGGGSGEYTSPVIVLDTTAPVISRANYSGNLYSGYYYSSAVTGSLSITETNFNPDDVVVDTSGTNLDGAIGIAPSSGSWSTSNKVHSNTFNYSSDAHYTFTLSYTDLAGNAAAAYSQDEFVVDATAPDNLSITYSTDVWGAVANTILWYDAPVTVTLSAHDTTAGVEEFTYNYPTKAGVSSVNVGQSGLSTTIGEESANVSYQFQIPSSALVATNQFDGSVDFTARDRSGNTTSMNGTEELIVDNIAPNATITYTNPVSSDEDTDYYSTPFEARILINEANFDASKVQISVTKDGNPYTAFTYSFTDKSVDEHEATIRFTENGAYVITISYTDQSTNDMDGDSVQGGTYTSRIKIIDQDAPVITVEDMNGTSNISEIDTTAYDDEDIHFNITFKDDNLLAEDVEVKLRAFEPLKEGEINLDNYGYVDENEHHVSSPATLAEGMEYSIRVDDLEKDAVYFMTCTATDQAGNFSSTKEIAFSVNRYGSTYYISDTVTNKLLNSYTNESSNVEIHEINVEELSRHDVSVIRDSSASILKEGDQFEIKNVTGEDMNWNDYTYTVFDQNFENEGVYTVQTNSVTDITEQESSSSNTGLEVKFVMDTTEPEAYISGIADKQKYDSESQPITITLSDNAMLKNAVVYVDDEILETEDFTAAAGVINTELPEKNFNQVVKVVAHDQAGNTYTTPDVTVRITSNIFFRYMELFIGGGIGALLILAGVIGLLVSRKRKKTA